MGTGGHLVGATAIIVGLQFLLPTGAIALVQSSSPKTDQTIIETSLNVQEMAINL